MTIEPSNGIILDAEVTPANVNDHEPYVECVTRAKQRYSGITEAAADGGYDYREIHKGLHDLDITGYIPHVERHRQSRRESRVSSADFVYDEEQDIYVCPAGKVLRFTHIETYALQRIYATRAADCRECPMREACLKPSAKYRRLKRNYLQDYSDRAHELNGNRRYRELQKMRSVWCEGTFAALKARHCLTRAIRRGLEKMREQVLMASTAMNLMRMARALA